MVQTPRSMFNFLGISSAISSRLSLRLQTEDITSVDLDVLVSIRNSETGYPQTYYNHTSSSLYYSSVPSGSTLEGDRLSLMWMLQDQQQLRERSLITS